MKTEKRFYVVSFEDEAFEEGGKFEGKSPSELTDEEIVELAEERGSVLSLDGLINEFNGGEILSDLDYIKAIDIPLYEDSAPHIKTINTIELASDLAHNAMLDEMQVSIDESEDDERVVSIVEGNRGYTEEARDIFNRWYDYFLTHIESTEI